MKKQLQRLVSFLLCPLLFVPICFGGRRLCTLSTTHSPHVCYAIHGIIYHPPPKNTPHQHAGLANSWEFLQRKWFLSYIHSLLVATMQKIGITCSSGWSNGNISFKQKKVLCKYVHPPKSKVVCGELSDDQPQLLNQEEIHRAQHTGSLVLC